MPAPPLVVFDDQDAMTQRQTSSNQSCFQSETGSAVAGCGVLAGATWWSWTASRARPHHVPFFSDAFAAARRSRWVLSRRYVTSYL